MSYELIPMWSGSLERSGAAPELSTYRGRSSIYHSPSYADADLCEPANGKRREDVKPRRKAQRLADYEPTVIELLRKGLSYGAISRQLLCNPSIPRNVARKNGLDRRHTSNWRGHREAP